MCLSVCGLQLSSRRRRDESSAGGGAQSTSESEAESDFEQTVSSCCVLLLYINSISSTLCLSIHCIVYLFRLVRVYLERYQSRYLSSLSGKVSVTSGDLNRYS